MEQKFKEFLAHQDIYLLEFKKGNKTDFLAQETLPNKGIVDVIYGIDNSQKSFEMRIVNISRIDNLTNKDDLYEVLNHLNKINSHGTYYEKENDINLKYTLYYQTVQDFDVQHAITVGFQLLNMAGIYYPEILKVL